MAERPGSHTYELPPTAPFTNHGKTKAAWTLIWLVCAGTLVIGLGMILSLMWLVIAGIVVTLAGVVAGVVLQRRGLGQPRNADEARQADWYA